MHMCRRTAAADDLYDMRLAGSAHAYVVKGIGGGWAFQARGMAGARVQTARWRLVRHQSGLVCPKQNYSFQPVV